MAEVRQNLAELESLERQGTDRLARLKGLGDTPGGSVSLGSLTGRFGGYRQPDLAEGARLHFSTSGVAEHAREDLIQDAFALYAGHRYFLRLTDEVSRLVFSELRVDLPEIRGGRRPRRGDAPR